LGGLVRLAARDRTDAAIAKPETPFVRVDELGADLRDVVGGAIECAARHQKYPLSLAWRAPSAARLPNTTTSISPKSTRPECSTVFPPLAGR
jgi:hypothetical protein